MSEPKEIESSYLIICHIGSGTYGDVTKAIHKQTGDIVALKKIKFVPRENGFSQVFLKEIRFLQKLDCVSHKNIIQLSRRCFNSNRRNLFII
jgi:serine/threonine protein kinase